MSETPLDVERLARALATESVRRWVHEAWVDSGVSEPGYATPDEMAAAIAREYAALAQPSPEPDLHRPQWEDCQVCGGDHWTKDHANFERAARHPDWPPRPPKPPKDREWDGS